MDSGSESVSGTLTPSQKKPRLFFTEDQKLALRRAYTADPYPNQAAIEQLASDIGVGVKTVVNWFHNHRMRAKQLPLNNGDLTPGLSPARLPTTPIKTEDGTDRILDVEKSGEGAVLSSPLPDVSQTVELVSHSRTGTTASSNKRKRARPHRLSEGTVLDRTDEQLSGSGQPVSGRPSSGHSDSSRPGSMPSQTMPFIGVGHTSLDPRLFALGQTVFGPGHLLLGQPIAGHPMPASPHDGSTETPIDLSVLTKPSNQDQQLVSEDPSSPLETTKTVVCQDEERERNIERLQRNLQQEPTDDWEF